MLHRNSRRVATLWRVVREQPCATVVTTKDFILGIFRDMVGFWWDFFVARLPEMAARVAPKPLQVSGEERMWAGGWPVQLVQLVPLLRAAHMRRLCFACSISSI